MAKKVLIVHYTPPSVVGGVEQIIEQHAGLLAAHDFSVELVAGRPGETTFPVHVIPEINPTLPENLALEKALASSAIPPAFHQARRSILASLKPLSASFDYLVAHNAFTLHFSLPLTAALWEIAAFRVPGTTIAWSHDLSWTNPLYQPDMHPGYPWELLRLPASGVKYVTVSGERKSELLELWGGGEATVIPNGIDVEAFLRLSPETRSLVARHNLFNCDLVLLLPSRVTRRKNIELAIKVVAALRARNISVRYLITGPTAQHHPLRSQQYLAELEELAGALDVRDNVIFLAQELGVSLKPRVVSELYSIADALLMPSSQEGFGLPLLEAGLARLPAVVSDIPVLKEVGGGDVIAFELDEDADRIAGKILEAVGSPSAKLFRRVLRDFRWQAIMERQILPLFSANPS